MPFPDANSVALYDFENNALDSSGNGFSLSILGAPGFSLTPTPIPQGLYCGGGAFTGADFFYMPYDPAPAPGTFYDDFSGLTAYTIEGFVYVNSLPSTQDVMMIYDDVNFQYGLLIRINSDGSISYYANGLLNVLTTAAGVVTAGAWYDIAVTTDATNKKIYVNNVLVATAAQTGGTPSGIGKQLAIGNTGFSALDGFIDQLLFSNVARTSFPTIPAPAASAALNDSRMRR